MLVVVALDAAARRPAVRPGLDVAAHRQDEPLRGGGDVGDGRVEGGEVARRWHAEAADLAHVLPCGGLDLTSGRGVVLVAEGSN